MEIVEKTNRIEYWQKVIAVFFFGWVVIWIYRTILTPIYPEIQLVLNIKSNADMAKIPSTFYTFYVAMQIGSGLLADRFGRKKILLIAFSIFAFGMAVISFSNSLNMVLVGAALVGTGQSAYFSCAFSVTNDSVEKSKGGFASAIVNCGCSLGMAIGLIGSSYFVKKLGIDWRILLRVLSIIAFLYVFVFLFTLKNDTPSLVKNKKQEENIPFLRVILNPKLIAAFVLYFATCYGYYMVITWFPKFLQSERNIQGVMIGYISSIVAFSSVPGSLLISKYADKNKNEKIKTLIFLEVISAITLLLAVLVKSNLVLVASLFIYGFFGKMAVDPILVSYVIQFSPQKAYGRVLAFLNFFGMSASIVSSYYTGVILDKTGTIKNSFTIASILLIFASIFLYIVNSKKNNINHIN